MKIFTDLKKNLRASIDVLNINVGLIGSSLTQFVQTSIKGYGLNVKVILIYFICT